MQELRSRRREEKLLALQFRLKEDVRLIGEDATPSPACLPACNHAQPSACKYCYMMQDTADLLSLQANTRMGSTWCIDAHRRLCLPFHKGIYMTRDVDTIEDIKKRTSDKLCHTPILHLHCLRNILSRYKTTLIAHNVSYMHLRCCRSFKKLRSVRETEYELDFVTNRANRDTQEYYMPSGSDSCQTVDSCNRFLLGNTQCRQHVMPFVLRGCTALTVAVPREHAG